jgi:hypothetical protein
MLHAISENHCVPAVNRWRTTVTFPRPSKMLMTRSQDGGCLRSTVKLSHETMIVPRRYHHFHDVRVAYWTKQSRFA